MKAKYHFNDLVEISADSPIAPGIHGVIVNFECWFEPLEQQPSHWQVEMIESPGSTFNIEDQYIRLIKAVSEEEKRAA